MLRRNKILILLLPLPLWKVGYIKLRRQATPPVPKVEIRPTEVLVYAPIPMVMEGRIEPLYEQFRKQHPLTIFGSIQLLVVEELLELITSYLNFIGVEGNNRVACTRHMLRGNARISWAVVSQTMDIGVMLWEDFKEVFNKNTSTTLFEQQSWRSSKSLRKVSIL